MHYAAHIATTLRTGLTERDLSISTAARELGNARQTLYDIVGGHTLPDLHTLAQAEQLLGRQLWPTFGEARGS